MDTIIFQSIHSVTGRFFALDLLAIFFAQYLPYCLFAAFVVLIFYRKNWQTRYYFIFLSLLSILLARGLVVEIIRFFYPRLRPFVLLQFSPLINQSSSASFPSGHSIFLFALVFVVYLINKKWFYYFLIASILSVVARIYVGVHWPSDVLVGAFLGAFVTWITWKFLIPKKVT